MVQSTEATRFGYDVCIVELTISFLGSAPSAAQVGACTNVFRHAGNITHRTLASAMLEGTSCFMTTPSPCLSYSTEQRALCNCHPTGETTEAGRAWMPYDSDKPCNFDRCCAIAMVWDAYTS